MSDSDGTRLGSLGAFSVCRAAMECRDFDEVAARLQVTNLGEVLAASAVLRESFDRGRMLRRLKELGATPFCLAEVARRLRLADEAALQELFQRDPEAADVFNEARHALAVQARALVMKSAQEGKPHAVKTLESLLRAEAGVSEVAEQIDFRRLGALTCEVQHGPTIPSRPVAYGILYVWGRCPPPPGIFRFRPEAG